MGGSLPSFCSARQVAFARQRVPSLFLTPARHDALQLVARELGVSFVGAANLVLSAGIGEALYSVRANTNGSPELSRLIEAISAEDSLYLDEESEREEVDESRMGDLLPVQLDVS